MKTEKEQGKHTPGPWEQGAETDRRHTTHYVKIGKSNAYTQRGVGMTEEEVRANARLIAAAPELLAALVEAEKVMCENLDPTQTETIKAIRLAREAIFKAGGAQ